MVFDSLFFANFGFTDRLLAARIGRRLDALHAAQELSDLDAHGFNLHRLKGNRLGEWAIWVSGNWRITFRFVKGEVHDIGLEDYH